MVVLMLPAAEVLGVGTDTATLFASQLLGFVAEPMLVNTYPEWFDLGEFHSPQLSSPGLDILRLHRCRRYGCSHRLLGSFATGQKAWRLSETSATTSEAKGLL